MLLMIQNLWDVILFQLGRFEGSRSAKTCLLGILEHAAEGNKQLLNLLLLTSRHGFAFQTTATDIIDHKYVFITFLILVHFLQKEPYRDKCRGTQST